MRDSGVGITEEEIKDFEEAWISKLKEAPEDVTDLEVWRDCERWILGEK